MAIGHKVLNTFSFGKNITSISYHFTLVIFLQRSGGLKTFFERDFPLVIINYRCTLKMISQ
jgi:hypothetical protein